ncbi:MAG: hypothetical protein CL946_10830 [Ectothiorhodospiraceae bacterium]|nr:hypothetical protein [Ectothiorhodospiraceae bacterium]
MKRHNSAPTIFILAAVLTFSVSAQQDGNVTNPFNRAQPFYFDAMNFAEYGEFGLNGRLDVYVHIPFNIIQFVKEDQFYEGSYTLTVYVNDSDGNLIKDETWERNLEILDFERTISPNVYDLSQRSFTIPAGDATVEVLFEDKESARSYRATKSVKVRSYDKNVFSMSDIMLVSEVKQNRGKRQVSPQINPNISMDQDGFFIFFELYNPHSMGSVDINYVITKQSNVAFQRRETQRVNKGRNTFITNISSTELAIGGYVLSVIATSPDDTTKSGILANASKPFVLEWVSESGTPIQITDLDEAIEQLRYFANGEQIDHMLAAETDEEKRERFEKFWEENNPSPGARVNTAMVEYYGRVAYANEHFDHFRPGWKTDRGMVFIKLGPPDYVERHPFEADTRPYIIWEYYDIGRRFVFVDETGFEDYRLLYPIWDERTRLH